MSKMNSIYCGMENTVLDISYTLKSSPCLHHQALRTNKWKECMSNFGLCLSTLSPNLI